VEGGSALLSSDRVMPTKESTASHEIAHQWIARRWDNFK